MRSKSLLAFALAIGCGLVAMVGVQQALQKQKVDPDADKVAVYVAATEIMPGQTIDLNMLEKRKFLKTSVPKEAVIDPKQLEKRALIVKAMPGDIIRIDKLGEEGKTGASISIPPGMRVVSLPTNTTQAHSGMIQPGDHVDVMVTYRVQPPSGGRDYPETKTILGNIQVFATDAERDANAGGDGTKGTMKNVSLLVNPDQAQTLMMGQSVGQICLSLRNAGDTKDVEITQLTPDLFRNSVVLNSTSNDPKPQAEPRADSKSELDDFLDDASGDQQQVAAQAVESETEPWEIAFYGKDGVKIETLEVARRKTPPPAAPVQQGEPKSVVNSLLNILQLPAGKGEKKQSETQNQNENVQSTDSQPIAVKPAAARKLPKPTNSAPKTPATTKAPATRTPTVSQTSAAK